MSRTLVIGTIAGVLLVSALVGLFLWQRQSSPSPQTEPEVLDTSNWQTYRNEEFGFEFMYPDEWEIIKTDPFSVSMVYKLEERRPRNSSEYWYPGEVSASKFVKQELLGGNDPIIPFEVFVEVYMSAFSERERALLETETSEVDGRPAFIITRVKDDPASGFLVDKIVLIDASPKEVVLISVQSFVEYEAYIRIVFDQILATFRFVE